MTFIKNDPYDVNFVIDGALRTVSAIFTGTVTECRGEKFLRFERVDPAGKLRVYQISEQGWNDMQLKAVGEAGSHEEYSFQGWGLRPQSFQYKCNPINVSVAGRENQCSLQATGIYLHIDYIYKLTPNNKEL